MKCMGTRVKMSYGAVKTFVKLSKVIGIKAASSLPVRLWQARQ